MATLVVATTLLIGADWGPPMAVAALVVAAISRRSAFRRWSSRSPARPQAAGGGHGGVGITLAILGGTFAPELAGARGLRDARAAHAARLVPARPRRHARAGRRRSPTACRRSLVLLAMGLVTGGIGMLRARRLVTPDDPAAKALDIGRVNLLRQLRDRGDLFFVFVLPTIIIVALGLQFGGPTAARARRRRARGRRGGRGAWSRSSRPDPTRFDVRRGRRRGAPLRSTGRARPARGRRRGPGRVRRRRSRRGHGRGPLPRARPTRSRPGLRAPVDAAVTRLARRRDRRPASPWPRASRTGTTRGSGRGGLRSTRPGRRRCRCRQVGAARRRSRGSHSSRSARRPSSCCSCSSTSMTAPARLVDTKQLGVSRRMVSTPTSLGTIVTGEALGRFAVALFQAAYIVIVSRARCSTSRGATRSRPGRSSSCSGSWRRGGAARRRRRDGPGSRRARSACSWVSRSARSAAA